MAKSQKYDTIEEVVAATGVELTDKTRPFLESFVKKAAGATESATAKKKDLLDKAVFFGIVGLDADAENVSTILVKIITHLFENGRLDEMKEFATANSLYVTDDGHIHRIRQAVKPIEQRNAGVKEGSVGYNTILLLKNPEFANLTAAELAGKQAEVYGQNTTAACVQWYINYCNKKKLAAEAAALVATEAGDDAGLTKAEAEIAAHVICVRQRAAKAGKSTEGGVTLGAELTLEKAQKPKGFQKKAAPADGAAPTEGGEPAAGEPAAGEPAAGSADLGEPMTLEP
jgi:hypothetical protein